MFRLSKGTRNLLFGEHQLVLHSLFVARAWWKLFGFPRDIRLWVCFFLHDVGYFGCTDIDGDTGRTHPELGAQIVHWLFDKKGKSEYWFVQPPVWYEFCLYHSRYYAKKEDHPISALALADKMAFVITPWWVFLPLARLSGGIREYLKLYDHNTTDLWEWHRKARESCWDWIYRTMEQPHPTKGYYISWERQKTDAKVPAVQEG